MIRHDDNHIEGWRTGIYRLIGQPVTVVTSTVSTYISLTEDNPSNAVSIYAIVL